MQWGMSETGAGILAQRRRRSPAEAEQLAIEFEASGLTRLAFCAGHDVSLTILGKYLRRHRLALPAIEAG